MAYDGPKVFLAPYGNSAARENFQRTVLEGVPENEVARYSNAYPSDDAVRIWGTKETVNSWKRVEPGDFVFFYRDGVYDYAASVLDTEKNEELGRALWPNHEEGSPWLQIIYLDEPLETEIEAAELANLAGYDRNHPLGFSTLHDMGVGGIRGRYGSVEALVQEGTGGSDTSHGGTPVPEAGIDVTNVPEVRIPESALQELYFPGEQAEEILEQVNSALNAGKHIVFTGPPGTGKTEIARLVCEHLVDRHSDVYTGRQITTATADWSTFETVGGYMPVEEEGGAGDELSFEPGQVLRRFKHNGAQSNELLVIDEINRADIDKSFGQLFTLLSGQPVQLPYKKGGEEIEILPAEKSPGGLPDHRYIVPSSWRILATMNSYDKTSLYELSYAFMRRFAFIHVGAPDVPEDGSGQVDLVRAYADVWNIDASGEVLADIGELWFTVNGLEDGRKIGPAIIEDILKHVTAMEADRETALTQAISNYVFPQLEGVPNRERIVQGIAGLGSVDRIRLGRLATDVLGVRIDG
jgi:energy-coupling factor transporter ATP-binding protein EcfA2